MTTLVQSRLAYRLGETHLWVRTPAPPSLVTHISANSFCRAKWWVECWGHFLGTPFMKILPRVALDVFILELVKVIKKGSPAVNFLGRRTRVVPAEIQALLGQCWSHSGCPSPWHWFSQILLTQKGTWISFSLFFRRVNTPWIVFLFSLFNTWVSF